MTDYYVFLALSIVTYGYAYLEFSYGVEKVSGLLRASLKALIVSLGIWAPIAVLWLSFGGN